MNWLVILTATVGFVSGIAGCAAVARPAPQSSPASPPYATPSTSPVHRTDRRAERPEAKPENADDPVERAFRKLLELDDTAQEEADRWIREAEAFAKQGAGPARGVVAAQIDQRFAEVKKAYENFLQLHPDHARARLAYGSFLSDTHDEEGSVVQWEKARELDPSNPAAWNNLANHYAHRGSPRKAFAYYEKAIELKPAEPVYLWNLAVVTYLFRSDAMEVYKLNETQVFERSLDLYRRALKLDPENFVLAHDYAQSFYGIKPLRSQQAIEAWNHALKLASDDLERQGILVHLARVELNSGLFTEARKHLAAITDPQFETIRKRLERNLDEKQQKAAPESENRSPAPPGKSD